MGRQNRLRGDVVLSVVETGGVVGQHQVEVGDVDVRLVPVDQRDPLRGQGTLPGLLAWNSCAGSGSSGLEELNRPPPGDPWFSRLRNAYLEPWGHGLTDTFVLAIVTGAFAHTFARSRQQDYLPEAARPEFDKRFSIVLRPAIRRSLACPS